MTIGSPLISTIISSYQKRTNLLPFFAKNPLLSQLPWLWCASRVFVGTECTRTKAGIISCLCRMTRLHAETALDSDMLWHGRLKPLCLYWSELSISISYSKWWLYTKHCSCINAIKHVLNVSLRLWKWFQVKVKSYLWRTRWVFNSDTKVKAWLFPVLLPTDNNRSAWQLKMEGSKWRRLWTCIV